jgi:hypothetical protein
MRSRNGRFLIIMVLTLSFILGIPVIVSAMGNSGDVSGTVTYTGSIQRFTQHPHWRAPKS